MTKTVLFDCDGVLADSEALGLAQTTSYLQSLGLQWTERDLVKLTGMRMDEVAYAFRAAFEHARGAPVSEDEVKDIFAGFVDIRRSLKHLLQPVAGAVEISKWLVDLNVPRAIASSSQAEFLESKLKRINLWDYYAPHVYSAEHVARGKPSPDIFLHAAKQLSAAPSECIVIEDSAHGVAAGLAANMIVWGFTGGGHCFDGHDQMLRQAGASQVFASHEELQRGLNNILNV